MDTRSLQLVLVHAAYGRSMIVAQSLESKLIVFLMSHAIENGYPINNDSLKKLTMGALVNQFIDKYKPSEELSDELISMVYFRNELAHRIIDTICCEAADDCWQDRVIEELTSIESYFHETNLLLKPYMERSHIVLKVTAEDTHELARKIYPGLMGSG